jgi:hypothetical protein
MIEQAPPRSRVLICGDRHYQDENLVWNILDGLYENHSIGYGVVYLSPFVVIEGGCPYGGADLFAETWCKNSPLHAPVMNPYDWYTISDKPDDCPVIHYHMPAKWEIYGRSAGPIRNREMLQECKPNFVIGFHNNIAISSGTKDMLNISKNAGVKTLLIEEW